MTKVKSKITPDTILKNFWKDNNRFADLFNACFFDGNPELNPDDLTEVDTDISSLLQFHGYAETVKKIVDVVKKSAYGVDFVILGIENQAKIHYAMPLRHMLGDAFSYLKEYNEIAKKYKGKITYLWGGKPTDAQIKGKEQPKKLDCSGFIQFVYSKYNKKRIESLGSTISISGLPKIKKNELQPGDIGLRNGTGSLYFDADGKSYSEPGMAQDANESKEKSFDKKIKARKTKKTQLKDRIEEKKDKISEYKDKITALNGKKDEVIDISESEISSDNDEQQEEISEEEKEQQDQQQRIDQQKKNNEKINALIKSYNEKIKKCQADINGYSERINKYDKQLKKLKKQRKKYKKDIEESIDHVGIYCGKNKKGEATWCHCSSSKGGVVYEMTDIFTHYYSANDYLSE